MAKGIRGWAHGGAILAAVGGVFWVAKVIGILLWNTQPALLFEAAPVLFAGGLLGLYVLTRDRAGTSGTIGATLAAASGALALAWVLSGPAQTDRDSFSPLALSSFLANLGSLVALGLASSKLHLFPGRARFVPLALGIATFPLMGIGGALETIDERLLELPVAVLGLAWMWLGALMWRSVPHPRRPLPAAPQ